MICKHPASHRTLRLVLVPTENVDARKKMRLLKKRKKERKKDKWILFMIPV